MLVNGRTGRLVATVVEMAVTRRDRNRGLLGRAWLEPGAAMFLAPCVSIHTAFMRFPIDVLFVGRDRRILRIVRRLPPWRAALCIRAHAVIELAAGSADAHDLRVGDYMKVA